MTTILRGAPDFIVEHQGTYTSPIPSTNKILFLHFLPVAAASRALINVLAPRQYAATREAFCVKKTAALIAQRQQSKKQKEENEKEDVLALMTAEDLYSPLRRFSNTFYLTRVIRDVRVFNEVVGEPYNFKLVSPQTLEKSNSSTTAVSSSSSSASSPSPFPRPQDHLVIPDLVRAMPFLQEVSLIIQGTSDSFDPLSSLRLLRKLDLEILPRAKLTAVDCEAVLEEISHCRAIEELSLVQFFVDDASALSRFYRKLRVLNVKNCMLENLKFLVFEEKQEISEGNKKEVVEYKEYQGEEEERKEEKEEVNVSEKKKKNKTVTVIRAFERLETLVIEKGLDMSQDEINEQFFERLPELICLQKLQIMNSASWLNKTVASPSFDMDAAFVNISEMPRLRDLQFGFQIPSNKNTSFFPRHCRDLGMISSLQNIFIALYFPSSGVINAKEHGLVGEDFAALANLPFLKSLTISCSSHSIAAGKLELVSFDAWPLKGNGEKVSRIEEQEGEEEENQENEGERSSYVHLSSPSSSSSSSSRYLLEELSLPALDISDAQVKQISALFSSSLQLLDLNANTQLTNNVSPALAKMTKLRSLDLEHCQKITSLDFAKHLVEMEDLTLPDKIQKEELENLIPLRKMRSFLCIDSSVEFILGTLCREDVWPAVCRVGILGRYGIKRNVFDALAWWKEEESKKEKVKQN